MPSQRQTFFTQVDEANLSDALKERFPDIRFEVRPHSQDIDPNPEIHYLDDISSTTRHEVIMFIPPKGWKPRYRKVEYPPGKLAIANYPEEFMVFQRSGFMYMERDPVRDGEPPVLLQGRLQVGKSYAMTPAEKSLRNKVWRIMSKISTPRLKARSDWQSDEDWVDIGGQMDCAGLDAVRWAFEDENRMFKSNIYFRPVDDLKP